MTHRLTRIVYGLLLFVVAVTLVVNLPPLEEIGKTPSSRIVTFSVDRWVTEIHRNIKEARQAELRGDHLRARPNGKVIRSYRDALFYFHQARDYAERRGSGSYIDDLIDESQARIHGKIARHKQ